MSALWLSAKRPVITSLHERLQKKTSETPMHHWLQRETPKEGGATEAAPAAGPLAVEAPAAPSSEALCLEALQRAEEARQAAEDELARLVKGLRQLEEVAQRIARPSAREVVDLAMTVAKEVISGELAYNAEPFYAVVQEALQTFSTEKHVTVRGNPATLERLLKIDEGLANGALALVSDASLQSAEILIETPTQAISYHPSRQLDLLREKLIALFSAREVSDVE